MQEVGDIEDLADQELEQLTDWHPLMEPALRYLAQHKIGLQPPREDIPFSLREAILTVDQEINRQREQRRENFREMETNRKAAREGL